jgi:hypothetical protein
VEQACAGTGVDELARKATQRTSAAAGPGDAPRPEANPPTAADGRPSHDRPRGRGLAKVLQNQHVVGLLIVATYALCYAFVDCKSELSGIFDGLLPSAPPPGEHASTTAWQAFAELVMDALLALLWFSAYLPGSLLRPKRVAFVISVIPAVGFALAMRDLYNPAVFFMGLTAVFVAAEHFGSLEHATTQIQEEAKVLATQAGLLNAQGTDLQTQAGLLQTQGAALEKQAGLLNEQGTAVQQQARYLEGQTTALERQTGTLENQAGMLRGLLDKYGLSHHRPKIFGDYRKATQRIDVVLRVVDIDRQWWEVASSHAPSASGQIEAAATPRTRDGIWESYFALPIADPAASQHSASSRSPVDLTLYQALAPESPDKPRTDKVQFVCRMPEAWPAAPDKLDPRDFEMLLGLTWRLVVLHRVREVRDRAWSRSAWSKTKSPPYVRAIVADCPSWIHAIDKTVYEVQPNSRALQLSLVREMTGREDSPEAGDAERADVLRRDLVRWAHDEVRKYGRSGGLAVDHVCALFRFLVITYDTSNNVTAFEPLRGLLGQLGLESWVQWRVGAGASNLGLPAIDAPTARLGCWCIFSTFFRLVTGKPDVSMSDLAEVIL